jgi:hypothetical protein
VSIVYDARRFAEQSKRGREATSRAPQSPASERRSPELHDSARINDEAELQGGPARQVRVTPRIACSDGSWASDISAITEDAAQLASFFLERRARFLVFDLQLVHYLTDIRNL